MVDGRDVLLLTEYGKTVLMAIFPKIIIGDQLVKVGYRADLDCFVVIVISSIVPLMKDQIINIRYLSIVTIEYSKTRL